MKILLEYSIFIFEDLVLGDKDILLGGIFEMEIKEEGEDNPRYILFWEDILGES